MQPLRNVVFAACAVCFCLPVTVDAKVVGDIVRVGFPSVGGIHQGRDLVRAGAWTPIVVDVGIEGQPSLEGWLRIATPDKDGDLGIDRQRVQLLAEQGNSRRYTLYTLAGHQSDVAVELINDDNNRLEVETRGVGSWHITPAMTAATLHDNDYLVLSVSSETVGKVVELQDPSNDEVSRPVFVAHIAPRELPSLWIGLEGVDAIVWDDAVPEDLTPAQMNALIEWTRQGGTLVVSSVKSAIELAKSPLAEILPVTLDETTTVTSLPNTQGLMSLQDDYSFSSPVPVVLCTLNDGAVAVEEDQIGEEIVPIVSRGLLGTGRVVFIAAQLRQLFRDEEANVQRFFIRTLELRYPKENAGVQPKVLFSEIDKWVGFSQVGALYLALALVFVAGYVLLATFGSWAFLKQKQWTKHSWSTFAVLALSCCFLSIIGVQSVRGVGRKLLQLSVVDGEIGTSAAQATTFYGVKTSVFGTLDFWLPQDYPREDDPENLRCMIKPLPAVVTLSSSPRSFIDPARYQLRPAQAEILDVPIRGTVKQFEGRWSGHLSGRVLADVHIVPGGGVSQADMVVSVNSKITNQLGVDVDHGYLVYGTKGIFQGGGWEDIGSSRPDDTYVIPLGPIADGETIMPGQTAYLDKNGVQLAFGDWSDKWGLDDVLEKLSKQWSFTGGTISGMPSGWSSVSRLETSLFVASFMEEYYPKLNTNNYGQFNQILFSLAHCRQMEIGGLVDRENALLILVTSSPGPSPLCVKSGDEYERMEPTEAYTMYRFRIPVNRQK